MVNQLGGTLEATYYAFGDMDVFVIADIPDSVTAAAAAAVSLVVNASGAVRLKTIPLLTPEEIDEASKKGVDYRVPGA